MAVPVVVVPAAQDIYDSDGLTMILASPHRGTYDVGGLGDNGLYDEITPRIGHEKTGNAVEETTVYSSYND